MDGQSGRRVTIIVFEGFELLDAFGPVELFGHTPGLSLEFAAPKIGPVRSSLGASCNAELTLAEITDPDIILVPGGAGTRHLVDDAAFLEQLASLGSQARLVTSVCTGSVLLAAAGLLEGHRATSNKRAFEWALTFGQDVDWVRQARWVEDGERWTSSGVAAGMDMAAALIESLFGAEMRREVTSKVEYEPQKDSTFDPFSVETEQ